ncbi:MAG TPA: hypothetical protein PK918_08635 [Methanotrichaceae archaeon]|nr:hypothetical protein [Methanotrichaceae archaeon]
MAAAIFLPQVAVILGGSRDNGPKAGDVWLIKIDNDGNELWK